jgi:hypothetical protein
MTTPLASGDVDFVLERFDQTEPSVQRVIVAELVRRLAVLTLERDEARKDTARLDWLEERAHATARGESAISIGVADHSGEDFTEGETIVMAHSWADETLGATLRDAIDAAMEETP